MGTFTKNNVAPAGVGDEQAAKNGADHGPYGKDGAKQAHGAVARLAEMIDHDARGRGREAGLAGGLQRSAAPG